MSKILVYIDGWFFHFGISKYFQEKRNDSLYAIIDVGEKTKKFYDNQKLVNFEKIWHYLDHIAINNKPDMEYLKSFEKKYNINLWEMAFVERHFLTEYNQFHKFSENEILSILEQECRFYEKVIDEINPDYLFNMQTDYHHNHLLYKMCESRGVKILMMVPLRFGTKWIISDSDNPSNLEDESNLKLKNRTMSEIYQYHKKFDPYKNALSYKKKHFESNFLKRYESIFKFFLYPSYKIPKNRYNYYKKTKAKIFYRKIINLFQRKYRVAFLNKHCIRKINDNESFIYFPLHYEPERVLLIQARYYSDQISVIKNLAKSIPFGYHLYVKEHPAMSTIGWRKTSFYKEIMELPNVRLIHPDVSPDEILKKCSLLITIAGSAGQDAVFYNKPVITFTDQLYCQIPNVTKINSWEELPKTIQDSLNKPPLAQSELNKYLDMIEKNSFEYNHIDLSAEFSYKFGFKGPVMDSELPEREISSFLEKHEDIFRKLASKYIEKIENYEKKGI